MFHIKICGVQSVEDAQLVAASGADALGLNFYPQSHRAISETTAREIAASLPPDFVKVGLFVNEQADTVNQLFDSLPLDLIQLHGDEEPEFLAQLGGRPVMRAFRVADAGLSSVWDYLGRCERLGCSPQMVMLDAHQAGQYGGTGKVVDWELAASYHSGDSTLPLVLAGGLTPDNVATAIHRVKPAAVDTASGVEATKAGKDSELVAAFVAAADRGFQELVDTD